MKKLFLFLIAFALLLSCKDRDQDSTVLPDATQSGKNTGGALVDGNVWVAKIESPNLGAGGMNATMYQNVNGEYTLQIVLRSIENPSGNTILINVVSNQDFTLGNYTLNDNQYNRGVYYISPTSYYTDSSNTGTLNITKLDKTNNIVSGTFSFKAKSSGGQIVNITQGRFDKKFVN